jgi:hypothetical protein
MKTKFSILSLLAVLITASGCRSFEYRFIAPAGNAGVVAGQPVPLHYDLLDYELQRRHGRLAMKILNPTKERIVLNGEKSYVIDPKGESHPLVGSAIGPGSYLDILFPPKTATGQVIGGTGGWAWAPGYRGGFAGSEPLYYGPPVTTYQIWTAYDWNWQTGTARIRLSYEQDGKTYEHNFEIVRERKK